MISQLSGGQFLCLVAIVGIIIVAVVDAVASVFKSGSGK